MQRDGKIVAVGSAYGHAGDFAVVRYNIDGSLDSSFGQGGKVLTDFGAFDFGTTVTLAPDGKIVVGGAARAAGSNYNFALARYNPNGSLDAGFGAGGRVLTDFGAYEYAADLALGADGKIVAVGSRYASSGLTDPHVALARYNADGTLDSRLDGDGRLLPGPGDAQSVLLQRGGKIVVASLMAPDYALVRFASNGTPDTTFGSGGKASFDSAIGAADLAEDARGRILAAGTTGGQSVDFALARYGPSGAGDADFGAGGYVRTRFGGRAHAVALAVGRDGKIVALGYSDGNFAAARFLPTYCLVPKLKGMPLGAAKQKIHDAHCAVGPLRRIYSRTVPKNRVAAQTSAAGARRAEAFPVGLVISRGRKR